LIPASTARIAWKCRSYGVLPRVTRDGAGFRQQGEDLGLTIAGKIESPEGARIGEGP